MSKKLSAVICAIAVIALCLSAVNLYLALRPQEKPAADVQYVLYLGTNDKDTNQPVFTPDEAKAKLKSILIGAVITLVTAAIVVGTVVCVKKHRTATAFSVCAYRGSAF